MNSIQKPSPANSYGAKVREHIEPTSQRQLEMDILFLKMSKAELKAQMAEARSKRSQVGDAETEKQLKEMRAQLEEINVELEVKERKLDKIYKEQLQPETKAREEAEKTVEERYDTVEISGAGLAEGEISEEDLEAAEIEEIDLGEASGMSAREGTALLRLMKELEEADGDDLPGKVFG